MKALSTLILTITLCGSIHKHLLASGGNKITADNRTTKTIGIVQPTLERDIYIIEEIIISEVIQNLENDYKIIYINSDSIPVSAKSIHYNPFYTKEVLNNKGMDAIMFIQHNFIEVDYSNYFALNEKSVESEIEIIIYNSSGEILARHYHNTCNSFSLKIKQKPLHTLEKATGRAISSVRKQLDSVSL